MKNKGNCNVVEIKVGLKNPSVRRIRIGNDIRLKLSIDGIDNLTQSNIKQARCYLIETTHGKLEKEMHDRHCRRFTREVFPEFYIPSPYRINTCGAPAYHVCPKNVAHYDHFLHDFHDYHWWPGYRGFGLHPDHFDHPHHIHLHPEHPFIAGPDRFPEPWYLAETEVLNELNTITCLFPAVSQCHCGVYKLVVVLTLFEQGWGKHNLRTYTIDKGPVFELVDDFTGDSGNITISVDDSGEIEDMITGIEIEHNEFVVRQFSSFGIGDDDVEGNRYFVYANLKDGTSALYNYYKWNFNQLVFSSSNPEVARVDQDGTIHTTESGPYRREAIITVQDKANLEINAQFKIIVKNLEDNMRIGFDFAETVDELSLDNLTTEEIVKDGTYSVNNDEDGKYLWVVSPRKINHIENGGFYIPTTQPVLKDGMLYYRSAAAILKGEMNFVVHN